MSEQLVTVEEAAHLLGLHEKTVLRYIRDGRLPAVRLGKGYRIARGQLEAFAGLATGAEPVEARATCVVDVPDMSLDRVGRLTRLLQAAALSGDGTAPRLHLETMFDPERASLKVVIIGSPADAGQLLDMLGVYLRSL